ncbi:MAG: type II toxin-antitoxin system HicA family toxin [Euryarchaeota archaeon]|nr:type II toxin-antitoxin system HicA family toxin [Euryarchaeota archaeon]
MPKLPVISGKKLVAALKKDGFVEVRQKGSHVSLQKIGPEKTYKTVVPLHKELAKGTLLDILKQTGLSRDDLRRLL